MAKRNKQQQRENQKTNEPKKHQAEFAQEFGADEAKKARKAEKREQ